MKNDETFIKFVQILLNNGIILLNYVKFCQILYKIEKYRRI